MSGTPLARAFVEIRPDTSRVKPEAEAALKTIDGGGAGDKAGREFAGKFDTTVRTQLNAAMKSLPKIEINANTTGADRQIEGIRLDLKALSDKKIGVDISDKDALAKVEVLRLNLERLSDTTKSVKIKIDTQSAIADLKKIETELDKIGGGGGGGGSGGGSGAGAGKGGFGGLIAGALILGPALIPITGAAIALAAGLAGLGAAGVLAFQGIKKEMAAGTPVGDKYTAGISVLKRDLATLESTAAKGVLTGFNRAVVQANALMPDLNRQVGSLSHVLGDVGANALTGLIGGFKTFEPLIQHTSLAIDGMSQKFAKWATGPGGASFGATLGADLDKVLPVLANLIGAVGKLIAAFAPVGNYLVGVIGALAAAINAIPVPVLQALAIAFSTLYTAAKLKGIFDGLAGSFTKMGVEAAASGSGLKVMGAGLAGLASHAVGIAAFSFAAYQASQSIGAWLYRNNSLTQVLDHSKDAVSNFTQAFHISNGAVDQGVTSAVQYQLEQDKLTDKLGKMGIGLGELTSAITGTGAQLPLLEAKLKSLGASDNTINAVKQLSEQFWAGKQAAAAMASANADLLKTQPNMWRSLATTSDSAKTLGDTLHLTAKQVENYAGMLGITKDQIDSGAISGGKLADAVKNVGGAFNTASQSGSAFLSAMDAFSKSAGTAADRGALIGAILKASQGDALAYAGSMVNAATANQALVTSFDKAQHSAVNWKTGLIDFKNAAAGPLIQNLQALQDAATAAATATFQHEVATKRAKNAALDAAAVFKNDTYNALIADAKALGITSGEAKKLADKYFAMPKSVTTTVLAAGTQAIVDVLNKLGGQLAHLTGFPWTVPVAVAANQAHIDLMNLQAQIDALHGKTITVTTLQNGNEQAGLPGHGRATGGLIVGAGTGTSDQAGLFALSNREFVSTAASVQKNQAALEAGNRGAKLVAVPGMADGGFVNVTPSAYAGGPGSPGYKGSSSSSAPVGNDVFSIHHGVVKGIVENLRQGTPLAAQAMRDLAAAMNKAFDLRGVQAHLSATINRIAALRGLQTALQGTVAQALQGGFDVTTAGQGANNPTGYTNIASILGAFRGQTGQDNLFTNLQHSLSNKGLNKDYLAALVSKGLASLPELQALNAGGKGDIANVNKAYSQYGNSINIASAASAHDVYGTQIAAQQKLQAAEIRQSQILQHSVQVLANEVKALTNHVTVIQIDGRTVAKSQSLQSSKLARR